jgi:hypothetical protein
MKYFPQPKRADLVKELKYNIDEETNKNRNPDLDVNIKPYATVQNKFVRFPGQASEGQSPRDDLNSDSEDEDYLLNNVI